MKDKSHFFLLLMAVITALIAGAVGPSVVYADDGDTSEPSGDSAPVSDPTGEDAVVEEPVFVPEVLEQAPEGTDLIVVNESGEVVLFATEEAAVIIASSDPMWCPASATPGDAGCTANFGTFDDLIDALAADAVSGSPVYTGDGIIWVEDTYNGNDNAQILFNGSVLTNIGASNLTIRGGWSGGNNTTITGVSDVDVALAILNWGGNVTLNNLVISATDNSGYGLFVDNTGSTTLDNVSVNDTMANPSGYGDGAMIVSSGNVDIDDSQFNGNQGNGLQVSSGGTISLDTVSADNNLLTGAYLDTCQYDSVTGLCVGTGLVTITSLTGNTFNGNDFVGLTVESGGGLNMDNTQANNNGLDGAVITSADKDGTGNVNIDQSEFTGNVNAYGLDVYTDGSLTLTNVTANSNSFGALLDTSAGTGAVDVSDSNFGESNITGNSWTGLHIESGSTVTLLNVMASYNGTNGAYVEAQGNINVTNSTFNENVHFNFPQDPGLYAHSNGGNITLVDVTADGNRFGAGAVLSTKNTGTISVSNTVPGTDHFNSNGTFGIQASTQDGNLNLTDVEASYNKSKGMYLSTSGLGNVFVLDGEIVENGYYGIYASTNEGDINLDTVSVLGDDGVATTSNDDLTDIGAMLKSYSGGNVFVTDSSFNHNTTTGLIVISSATVELNNVTADQNGVNGVEIYTPQTAYCRGASEATTQVIVNVDAGTFTNNGEYGILAMPGPAGTLNFVAPSVFGGNGTGDYLLDLREPTICPVEVQEPTEPKKPQIVPAPTVQPVAQDCSQFSSTVHELSDGTFVNVGCPYEGFSSLNEVTVKDLPGALGAGTQFLGGVRVSLTDASGNTILNQNGTVTISFALPKTVRGRTPSILFWDPTLNGGKGGWMKLPIFEAGTSFPLHPEDPDDLRVVTSGVQQVDGSITLTVNFSGIFVMTIP